MFKIWSCDEHKKPKQTLSGHFGYVVDIAWADIDTLVSGSYDGAVKVSISPTFYGQFFHTKLFCEAFLYFQFGIVISLVKEYLQKCYT